jgi:hypothetical protein
LDAQSFEQDVLLARRAILLADDIEKDIQADNSIVRYLLTRAREAAVHALADMMHANPDDAPQIKALQSLYNHYGDLRVWLAEAIANGNDADAELEGVMMSTPEAREAIQAIWANAEQAVAELEDE